MKKQQAAFLSLCCWEKIVAEILQTKGRSRYTLRTGCIDVIGFLSEGGDSPSLP